MRHLHRVAVGALALCVLAVAVPAASADSIAYIKEGNVWLSTPDGSRQVPVTNTGGYSDVSQADDGTMIALKGVRLHRLDRGGNVLADFDTPVSTDGPTKTFYGPFEPAVSPDGTKVAYTYYYMTQSQDPTCFPPTCVIGINEGGTGYSHADRQTGWDEPGLGRHSGWRHPAWVDNDTTLLGNPTHMPNGDVVLDTLSDGSTGNLVHNWFTDKSEGNPHVSGGDITRDRRKLAFQTGPGDSTLSVYHVPSFPTTFRDSEADASTLPTICYRYSGPNGGKYSQPTFSPDGAGLAWAEGDGVHVASVPGFEAGCSMAGATPSPPLVLPGGSEPDWGPADVPAPAARPAPAPAAAANVTASVKRARLRSALRKGLKIAVTLPADGRLTATAKAGRRTVARSAGRRMRAGTRTVTLRFTKAARKALARRKRVKLSIRVSLAVAGGQKQSAALRVTLRR